MKILLYGNAPTVGSGYGVQIKHLARRLRDDGHDVAIQSTFGQQYSGRDWEGIQVYPNGYEANSNDVVHDHALMHFDGDATAGWIIVLNDLWAIVNPLLSQFNVVGWCPVDHHPVPKGVISFFHRTEAIPAAMSRFGERLLAASGLAPSYLPLAVDTKEYKPRSACQIKPGVVASGRELMGVEKDAFLVLMVAMNKDPLDRKGFNEAFRAFGAFHRRHPDSILYVHTDASGHGQGLDLAELATHASVPVHAIRFTASLGYRHGFSPEMMAAVYSAADVLLAPSRGEGFCVPLIEAQACGTPVIATDFSAQPELVGAGWTVHGQPYWNPSQSASWVIASIPDIVDKLELAYEARGDQDLAKRAVGFAAQYDVDRVYDDYWRPFLALLDDDPGPVPLDRSEPFTVDVIVPLMRPENLERLVSSFQATAPAAASLVIIHDQLVPNDGPSYPGAKFGCTEPEAALGEGRTTTYAEKVNYGLQHFSNAAFALLVGDDVEFHPGWFEAAEKLADRYDVIGTNDSRPGRTRNLEVADGTHADHFFVRRSYVDTYGASLDGPGVLAPTCYRHWFTDKEIVELAKAREVFTPCLDSIVEHHHPGYDGDDRDLVYVSAIQSSEDDLRTYQSREPLIRMQRRTLRKKR